MPNEQPELKYLKKIGMCSSPPASLFLPSLPRPADAVRHIKLI